MARRESALQRAKRVFDRETAKAASLLARTPKPYKQKGVTVTYITRSLVESFDLSVNFSKENFEVFAGGVDATSFANAATMLNLRLLTSLSETDAAKVKEARNFASPSQLIWTFGDATPNKETSEWGTKWIKYYDLDAKGQASRSVPISPQNDNDKASELIIFAGTIFNSIDGTKKSLLGALGKAYIKIEGRKRPTKI